jgi:voltage-gated potassium channel
VSERDPTRRVRLPHSRRSPLQRIVRRILLATGLIVFTAMLAYIERDGYADADGTAVSLLDAFYYATVSVTTTGYGDIRPESDMARLVTTVLVTPARILFLIVLVGTTLEVLAEDTRDALRVGRWRRMLRDHVIVCGFGTKGRSAVDSLLGHGVEASQIVVIDENPSACRDAETLGLATVAGSAALSEVLRAAGIEDARSVIVAPDRDDAAVLITLTAREHNANASIISAVREEENVHLLRQSGASQVVLTSGSAGRLLGLATQQPAAVRVIEDLLTIGEGLDVVERPVITPCSRAEMDVSGPVLAVVRGDDLLRFDDPRCDQLEPGDRLVMLVSAER